MSELSTEPVAESVPEQIEWREPAPNKMFPPQITALIRIGLTAERGPCAVCKKKSKSRWTMLCPFVAHTMTGFSLTPSGVLEPLTLVCGDHPISPREDIQKAI